MSGHNDDLDCFPRVKVNRSKASILALHCICTLKVLPLEASIKQMLAIILKPTNFKWVYSRIRALTTKNDTRNTIYLPEWS